MQEIIEEIYDQDIPFDGEHYWCPVCLKKYKNKGWLMKHLGKQQCFSLKDILSGTDLEKELFELYKMLNPSECTKKMMYNDPIFDRLATFLNFCRSNRIDPSFYLAYNQARFEQYGPYKIIDIGMKNKTLKEFYEFRRNHPEFNDQEAFIETYRDRLVSEPKFLIRSFERGDITLSFFERYTGRSIRDFLNKDQRDIVFSLFEEDMKDAV